VGAVRDDVACWRARNESTNEARVEAHRVVVAGGGGVCGRARVRPQKKWQKPQGGTKIM